MKRLLAFVVAVLALLPVQAASADTPGLSAGVFPNDELTPLSSSGNSFAVGGGSTVNGTQFAFSAHLNPKGPAGYAVVKDPICGEAQGHVCGYAPVGARSALFSIVVEKGSGILGDLPNVTFMVTDNSGTGTPSFFMFMLAEGCQDIGDGVNGVVTRGNIVVKNR